MEVRGILAELLSEMTISDARACLFEKLRRTPVPSRTRIATSSSSPEEMTMSSSSVRLASRSSSVVARARGDRTTPRRARAHPRYRRLRRRRSIDRKTSSRRDGGARDESLVAFLSQFSFSHFSMTTKRIARVAGTSSSSRWTPVRFIFFDVARTTRVKARRDARHARHSVLMSRGGVIGCAVLSCVRFERK